MSPPPITPTIEVAVNRVVVAVISSEVDVPSAVVQVIISVIVSVTSAVRLCEVQVS